MSFKDYSLVASGNTALGDGTYIGPGMLRNKVRPAFQQLAADGKELADDLADVQADIAAAGANFGDAIIPTHQPYGAIADGETTATDNAVALQAALDTGRPVFLAPDKTYAFGSPLFPPAGGGFVGRGKLLMLTGTGKFDHADYTGDPLTYSGIVAEGLGDIHIEARIQMQDNAGIRCCNAIWIRNCTDVHLDVECWGFKEARYGIVEWNSNAGGSVKLYAHDCNPNTNTLPSMQVTGLSVDSNRYDPGTGPVNSRRLRFDVNAVNLELGATAIARYGYQTDGVNLQGSGFAGHIGRVVAENVDEPLDCWSDSNVIEVAARDCFWGVKLIYGASFNNIRATVNTYRKAGAVYAGAVAGQKATAYNRVNLVATGGGTIGTEGDVAGVRFEDPTTITVVPTLNTPSTAATGGSLAAGTYYYKVTALGVTGETIGSNEVSKVTTGATSTVTLTWSAVPGAAGYRVYRGTAAGSENVFYAPGNVTTFTDTGAAGTAGSVPVSNTAVGYSPDSNFTEITVHGDGTNLDYGAHIKSGSNNVVRQIADGYAVAPSLITSTGTGNVVGAP